jgi:hypothetical protein
MLVEPEFIVGARQDVAAKGGGLALSELALTEPALASFISTSLESLAGRLSLSGAPIEVVQGVHEDTLTVVLTCVQAIHRGHYALWKDQMTGTRLAQLDDQFRKPARRPRKKRQDINPETGPEESR